MIVSAPRSCVRASVPMSRPAVPSRFCYWPRFAVLAAVGLSAAGCADSARFTSASNTPPSDVTGSIAARPAPRVDAQPLPAPPSGVAAGAQGLGAYRPATRKPEYTGSIASRPAPAPAPVQAQGHWTWDGGSPVVVRQGETLESIARKHGVPASAILETNGLRGPVRPGQRLVIPRYVSAAASSSRPAQHSELPRTASIPRRAEPRNESQSGDVHIVQPGENLIGIARRHGITVAELARANRIEPYAKVAMGDRLTIPGRVRQQAPERPAQAIARAEPPRAARPQVAAPRSAPVETTQSENIRVAKPEAPPAPEPAAQQAEPVGHVPSFRWPVTAHIVEGFGPRPNGTTNDGINFAVPE